jgi:hypothetical protein
MVADIDDVDRADEAIRRSGNAAQVATSGGHSTTASRTGRRCDTQALGIGRIKAAPACGGAALAAQVGKVYWLLGEH